MQYSLEFLEKKFSEHAIQAEKNQKELKKSFSENNPGQDFPDHMQEDFNLPKALACLCKEISSLKDSIEHLKK